MKRSSAGKLIASCWCTLHDEKEDGNSPVKAISDQIDLVQSRLKNSKLTKSDKSRNFCLSCVAKVINESYKENTDDKKSYSHFFEGLMQSLEKEIKDDIKHLFATSFDFPDIITYAPSTLVGETTTNIGFGF